MDRCFLFALFAALSLPVATTNAQADSPIQTDRPDFTEGTRTVPSGRFQLEAGYTFSVDREGGTRVRDHTFPESLLRVGLADGVELRVAWEGWSLTQTLEHVRDDDGRLVSRKTHDDGGTDMTLGLKFHLHEQDGAVPDLGVIVEASLPTGTGSKSSGDVDPGVKFLWAYDLSERLAIAGNLNISSITDDRGRFAQGAASLSVWTALTDWMGGYVEYYGLYPNTRDTDCAHYINGGLTFPVTDDLQFDVRAGAGLNEEADDFLAGVGFAVRF
jgi:hypothetical protein